VNQKRKRIFSEKKTFHLLTNSFYTEKNGILYNWGDITEDCRAFIKYLIKPSLSTEERVKDIFTQEYGFDLNTPFRCIHIRTGDYNLHHNHMDIKWLSTYLPSIKMCVLSENGPCVLISDCSILAKKLVEHIPGLYYWDNPKIHTGCLINNEGSALLDTLCDFFILSKASKIYYTYNGTGFSIINSILYHIPYQKILPYKPKNTFQKLSYSITAF
jgi:hypothetical protein